MNENKLTPMIKSLDKNFLSSGDIDPVKKTLTLTIQSIQFEKTYDPISKKTKIAKVITFKENYKPMICNVTNSKKLHDCGLTIMEEAGNWAVVLFVAKVEGNGYLVKYDESGKEERKIGKRIVDGLRVKYAFSVEEVEAILEQDFENLQPNLKEKIKQTKENDFKDLDAEVKAKLNAKLNKEAKEEFKILRTELRTKIKDMQEERYKQQQQKEIKQRELEILRVKLSENLKIYIEKKPAYTIEEFEKKYGFIKDLNIYECKSANERIEKALEKIKNETNNN